MVHKWWWVRVWSIFAMVNEKTKLGLNFTPWAKYGFWPVQVSDISTLKFSGEKIKCCTKNFELLWGAFYSTFNAEYWEKYQRNKKTYKNISTFKSYGELFIKLRKRNTGRNKATNLVADFLNIKMNIKCIQNWIIFSDEMNKNIFRCWLRLVADDGAGQYESRRLGEIFYFYLFIYLLF